MIILAIDTATAQVSCALGGQEGVLASFRSSRGQRHAEVLTPAIKFLTEQAKVSLSEVSVIALDVGPGLFTGLRVGIATAKSMSQALRVPIIPFSSLDLLAYDVRQSSRVIVPIIDAKRGEVFSAQYRRVADGIQRVAEPAVLSPEKLVIDLESKREDYLLVGDGARAYVEEFGKVSGTEILTTSNLYPSPDALVELAHPRALREEWVQASDVQPLYMRNSDAELNFNPFDENS